MRMDLSKKNGTDLEKMTVEKREELRVFRFGSAGSRTRNVRLGRTLKRDIARIKTEVRKRMIEDTNLQKDE